MRRTLGIAISGVLLLLAGLAPAASAAGPKVEYQEILKGYSRPVLVTYAPGNPGDIYIVEQTGKVARATTNNGKKWTKAGTFLDLTDKVIDPNLPDRNEQGLLGLAFHPNYASNGLFYVNYTRKGAGGDENDTVIAEYRRGGSGAVDPSSARVVMVIDQPFINHNGGHLAFGPDGYLYIGMGDGGGHGDPNDNGQDMSTLLGKILRIDPRDPDGLDSYSVPADNPFVGDPGRDEIWASGTRNPWRFSFDRENGDLWIGEVGEGAREEIDRDRANASGLNAGKGNNLGWSRCEGSLTFKPVAGNPCPETVGKVPLYEYGHADGWCSVTGGFVYRGPINPAWQGLYIAADWCGGQFVLGQTGDVRLRKVGTIHITSFGEDAAKRLFAVGDGKVYLVKPNGARP